MKEIVLMLVCSIGFVETHAWGFYAHRMINYHAVFLLPPEMIILYKPHIHFLSEHAVDPDKRRYAFAEEGPRHYIDLDRYGKYPFEALPRQWKAAVAKYGEDSLKAHGISPWWIQVMLSHLTEAFKNGDCTKILKLSADLGHYIGDAHVPLHTSSNHNGQFTGQHGIHGFWESRVPELLAEKEWEFFAGSARYLKKPLDFSWNIILQSGKAADSVLAFEKELSLRFPADAKYSFENRNGVLTRQYSSLYTREYDRVLQGMVQRRFVESVHSVASAWYTAWVNAGQPDLSKIINNAGSAADSAALEELNIRWHEGAVKGKSCD